MLSLILSTGQDKLFHYNKSNSLIYNILLLVGKLIYYILVYQLDFVTPGNKHS